MDEERQGRAYLLGDICIDLSLVVPEVMGNAAGQQEPASSGGGTVANTACALAKLGLETHFLGTLGDDYAGRLVRSELDTLGIRTEGLLVSSEKPTQQVIALTDATGQRTTFVWPQGEPAYLELGKSQLEFLNLEPQDWLHSSGICLAGAKAAETVLAGLEIAANRGSTTTFDLSLRFGLRDGTLPEDFRHNLWRAIRLSDHVLGTVEEELIHLVPDEPDARLATQDLAKAGDCTAVMRESGVGAYVSQHGGPTFTVPQFRVPVVDTLGAGDAFAAGYIFGGVSCQPLADQVRIAHAVAGYKVGGRGAHFLPDKKELNRFLLEYSQIEGY